MTKQIQTVAIKEELKKEFEKLFVHKGEDCNDPAEQWAWTIRGSFPIEVWAWFEEKIAQAQQEAVDKIIQLIESRKNNVDACGYGDCDDSVWAELEELKDEIEALQTKEEGSHE